MNKIKNDERVICIELKKYSISEIDDIIFKLKRFRSKLALEIKQNKQSEEDFQAFIDIQNQINPTFKIERKKVKFIRQAKYQYLSHDGERRFWAGVGRKPKEIQEALERGETLDSFLIDPEK
jgi:DNA-binding protein H-NS